MLGDCEQLVSNGGIICESGCGGGCFCLRASRFFSSLLTIELSS